MPRIAKRDESTIAIMEWFERGNTGTIKDISWALGISDEVVTAEVRRMLRRKEVRVITRYGSVAIYGEDDVAIKREPVDVTSAISSQPDLVRFWNAK